MSSGVVLVVPPFAGVDRPALGPHLLQAVGREAGFDVTIFYANMRFAHVLGESLYHRICYASATGLAGEQVFADHAYGVAGPGDRVPSGGTNPKRLFTEEPPAVTVAEVKSASVAGTGWLLEVVAEILALGCDVVGCSTTFEQTAASVAILRRLKQSRPQIVTVLGGANCEGEMGDGLAGLVPEVDYVFGGECEAVFPGFLKELAAMRRPTRRVVRGAPCEDMNALPLLDYSDYYEQLALIEDFQLVQKKNIWLPYESSRGCWWGAKHHCTFCGVNGETLSFRRKAAQRVIGELSSLLQRHPSKRVCIVDNIMPREYFRTLLPALAGNKLGAHIFCEQKANLKLKEVKSLRDGGVAIIQPGIEALSSPLLRLMGKGVSASQNVRLLRYCRCFDIAVNWNLLFGFPQDRLIWYKDTLQLLPLLRHLYPPSGFMRLSIDRFSPYFKNPGAFGISAVVPMQAYRDVLPHDADVGQIAYHFRGDFESESTRDEGVIDAISDEIASWRRAWMARCPPVLAVTQLDGSSFLVADSRSGGNPTFEFLKEADARLILCGGEDSAEQNIRWAAERGWIARVDNRWIALATADGGLLEYFEGAEVVPARPQFTSPGGPGLSLPQTSSRQRSGVTDLIRRDPV